MQETKEDRRKESERERKKKENTNSEFQFTNPETKVCYRIFHRQKEP